MTRLVGAAILALGIAVAGWFTGRGLYEARVSARFVTVKGVAERPVQADLAVWPLTVVVSDNELETAHAKLSSSIAAVSAFLEKNGISSANLTSQGFSVVDTHANRYSSVEPGIRYTINQTLVVRSDDPDVVLSASSRVSELLAAGVVLQSGGGYQGGPTFIFTRLNELKPEMIAEATSRAREAAAQFALDAGATVGGIRRANQGVFQILARDRIDSIREEQQLHKVVRVVSTVEYFLEE